MAINHIRLNGVHYVTVETYANLTHRSQEQIRRLIRNGNTIRRLLAIKQTNHYLIPIDEVFDYPFVEPGRIGKIIKYHRYNRDGTLSLLDLPVT